MNLTTMRTEARTLVPGETDSTNTHFTDAQLNTWANEAYRYLVTMLGDLPITERDYTSAAAVSGISTFTLNAGNLSIDAAYIQAQPENKWKELFVIDLDQLKVLDPGWMDATAGTPEYLVRRNTFTAVLYPPPNSANQNQKVRVHALEFPTPLSADTDTPTLPQNLHDIFPHYMAYRMFKQIGQKEESTAELIMVNSLLKSQRLISSRFSKQNVTWQWIE